MEGHQWDQIPHTHWRSLGRAMAPPPSARAGPSPRIRVRMGGSGLTHGPFVGVPGVEPSSEGGRLVALLDQHDRRGQAPPCWVRLQVLPAPGHGLLLPLARSCPQPQENLGHRGGLALGGWS